MMKLHLLLFVSCALQIIPTYSQAYGHLRIRSDEEHHHHSTAQSDEMVVKKRTASSLSNNIGMLQSHRRRSLQQNNTSNDAPSVAPSEQPALEPNNPFNTGCDPEWEAKLVEYNRTRQEIWTNPTCYSYIFVRTCFCPPEYMRPVRVHVTNDTVTNVSYVMDDDANATIVGEYDRHFPTMNELFDIVNNSCFDGCPDDGATLCLMEYDNVTGTIDHVYIDHSKMIMDEEMVSQPNFSALKRNIFTLIRFSLALFFPTITALFHF
jgi:Family of unknown function (DUF6174)